MKAGDSSSRLFAIKQPHYIVVCTGQNNSTSYKTYKEALEAAVKWYEKLKGGWFWIYKSEGVVRPTDGSGTPWRHDRIVKEEKEDGLNSK
jgi:hypothetical protein